MSKTLILSLAKLEDDRLQRVSTAVCADSIRGDTGDGQAVAGDALGCQNRPGL